jgi:hypothetical protein
MKLLLDANLSNLLIQRKDDILLLLNSSELGLLEIIAK